MTVERNSEILFLYDARLCNPNGDPDEENRPRMDYETRRNLVSDVRLKRYLRDYWIEWNPDTWTQKPWEYEASQDVWVRTMGGTTVSAKQRIDELAQTYLENTGSKKRSTKDVAKDPDFRKWLLKHLVDVRMFGATIPIGAEQEGGAGGHITYTGPVQFSWGYSLNRADLVPSSTITSHFAGRERGEKGEYGTMGKDWRVKYSFLAFYGLVSAWRARETGLLSKDVELLEYSLINSLPLIATSRSKIGQTPRLYLWVEYVDDATFLGDFRTRLTLKEDEGLEGIADVDLDFAGIVDWLAHHKTAIHKVVVWAHGEFVGGQALVSALKGMLGEEKVQSFDASIQEPQSSS